VADGGEWRMAAAAEGRRALEQRISVAAARWRGGGGQPRDGATIAQQGGRRGGRRR
jgi:hypothetical protein